MNPSLCKTALAALIFATALHTRVLPGKAGATLRTISAKGIVRALKPDHQMILIEHEAISNYMAAMTMPFRVNQPKDMVGLQKGDAVTFRLLVAEDKSWIDRIVKTGRPSLSETNVSHTVGASALTNSRHPLLDYEFTNELGLAVSLNEFRGQALAITFFFTRCPIPDYCPRLSKNFAEASRKLGNLPDAPTNWHFLSVTFDPGFDTPAVLKRYGEQHQYDPNRWSFLTGPPDRIAELARQSEVTFAREGGSFNHNFRTLIVNAAGQLQMVFPTGGDLSDAIVSEMLKAVAPTNRAGIVE